MPTVFQEERIAHVWFALLEGVAWINAWIDELKPPTI